MLILAFEARVCGGQVRDPGLRKYKTRGPAFALYHRKAGPRAFNKIGLRQGRHSGTISGHGKAFQKNPIRRNFNDCSNTN